MRYRLRQKSIGRNTNLTVESRSTLLLGVPRVDKFNDGAVIAQRGSTAERGHSREYILQVAVLRRHCFQTLGIEEISASVLSFSDSDCYEDDAIARLKRTPVGCVLRIPEQPDRQIPVFWSTHLMIGDPQRRNVSAIHVLEYPIPVDTGNDHCRVFLSNMLLREEAIDGAHNFSKWHAGEQMRVHHPLKDGS